MKNAARSHYIWTSSTPESSHSYLDAIVISAVRDRISTALVDGRLPRAFDAGCGNGALLSKLVHAGFSGAGCELSPEGASIARTVLGEGVRVECMSVYDDLAATFGNDWDVVVSTEVVEHLYDPRLFVGRVRDMLHPGGSFILSTPYHGYVKNLAMALTGKMDSHFTALWDGGHIKFWSYKTLRVLLSEGGFCDFRFYGAGRLPWLWKSMVVSCRKA